MSPELPPKSPVVDDVVEDPVRSSALRIPDSTDVDDVDDVDEAGDARLCSIVEISCDSDACEVPAEVPAA
jgi:hypothetical protein